MGRGRLLIETTFGNDVVDDRVGGVLAERHRRGRLVVLAQPACFVVGRVQALGLRVVAPGRDAGTSAGGEAALDRPPAVAAVGVPVHVGCGHATVRKTAADTFADRGALLTSADADVQRQLLCGERHVVALGADRRFESADLVGGPPGALGDLVDRQTGAQQRLDVAGTHVRVDAVVVQPGAHRADGAAQGIVDLDLVLFTVVVDEEQSRAFVIDTDESQVAHVYVCLPGLRQTVVHLATVSVIRPDGTPGARHTRDLDGCRAPPRGRG